MKKTWIVGALLLVVFLGLRLPALHMPYHQDEWKEVWSVSQGAASAGSFFAHPPLTALSFRLDAALFGLKNMRLLPILFSLISGLLLFLVVRRKSDIQTAGIAVALYVVSFYSIFASLMIDTDGAILPTVFLLVIYAYERTKSATKSQQKIIWWILVVLALLVGLLVKLSFILVVAVIIADVFIDNRKHITKKWLIYAASACAAFIVAILVIFTGLHFVYPAFSLGGMIEHARTYMHLGGRNYSQVLFEGIKSILYLSPLLLVPLVFVTKKIFSATRLYWLYLIFGFVFYFILFDFSRGALDKYMMFTIVPLCVISAFIIRQNFLKQEALGREYGLLAGIVLSVVLYFLQFVHNVIPSLYPKTEWLSRVIHLKWNMLMPFNGGSGPMGFYVSFLFIALVFLISVICAIVGLMKPAWRSSLLIIVICLGITYSLVFAEEYALGKVNGKTADVLQPLVSYVSTDSSGDQYITYNDIGAFELMTMSKYGGRFYATPESQDAHLQRFAAFSGKYLIVDMPRIDPSSDYAAFFRTCTVLASSTSRNIEGEIYSCKAPSAQGKLH